MSSDDFLSKQNVKIIWDVLIDEDILKDKSKDIIAQTSTVFSKNIVPFYEIEKKNTNNLIELNKKFITLIMNFVSKNFPNNQVHQRQIPQPQSQTSSKKELITYEDLQSDRQSEFEKELSKKQKEFTNFMTVQVPQTPNFSDNIDAPLGEMEMEIKKMMAQRKYDLENIKSVNSDQVDNWLKPRETSLKSDKVPNVSPPLKYIKIDKNDINENIYRNDIIELSSPSAQKKQISWADDTQTHENENSIFKKLKLLPHMLENENENQQVKTNDNFLERNENSKIEHIEDNIKLINNKIEDINKKVSSILEILQFLQNK